MDTRMGTQSESSTSSAVAPIQSIETLTDTELVAWAREQRRLADTSEARLLRAACWWADRHSADSIATAETFTVEGIETGVLLGGVGCPLIAEFAVAEFAAAVGLGPEAGKHLVAEALELRHRLPRLWRRVQCGEVQAWRGRSIASETQGLSREAADHVDRHLAPFAHSSRPWQLRRLVDEALAQFMPVEADRIRRQAADRRHLSIDTRQVSFEGTSQLHGELDLHDALSLDCALAHGAAILKDLGSTDSLDARRAAALGQLARGEEPLPLARGSQEKPSFVLHLHLSAAAIQRASTQPRLGRTEESRALITAETIRAWCGADPRTAITVRPVIDLNQEVAVDAVEVPDRVRHHVIARDRSCVFPWCTRPARRADCDHIFPSGADGPTCTCNLAALCRTHHRVKTHEHRRRGWSYTPLEPGTYLWVSPLGLAFLRTPSGTTDVTRPNWPHASTTLEPPRALRPKRPDPP